LVTGELDPQIFEAVKVIVLVPTLVYIVDGFCILEVAGEAPLPKFQDQLLGELLEASVNETVCPTTTGGTLSTLKFAVGGFPAYK
jgi:hypothetical protein